jgi:hypothetical protein
MQNPFPDVILSQKCHMHMGPVGNGYTATRTYSKSNKVEKKEVHYVFAENS